MRHDLHRIACVAAHLKSRVRSIYTIAKIESGSLSGIERRFVEGAEIIRIVIDALERCSELIGERRAVTFRTEQTDEFIGGECFANHSLISHMLWEIVKNAYQFSSQGSTVNARFLLERGNLVVELRNQGMILKAEEVKNVAKRGWRSASAVLSAVK